MSIALIYRPSPHVSWLSTPSTAIYLTWGVPTMERKKASVYRSRSSYIHCVVRDQRFVHSVNGWKRVSWTNSTHTAHQRGRACGLDDTICETRVLKIHIHTTLLCLFVVVYSFYNCMHNVYKYYHICMCSVQRLYTIWMSSKRVQLSPNNWTEEWRNNLNNHLIWMMWIMDNRGGVLQTQNIMLCMLPEMTFPKPFNPTTTALIVRRFQCT